MKTNQLLVKVVMVLLFGGSFVSCNDDDIRMETQKNELEVDLSGVYKASQDFILNRNSSALESVNQFICEDIKATRGEVTGDSVKLQILKDFEDDKQISDSQLAQYLENNPENIDALVEAICSKEFFVKFKEVSTLYNKDLENNFIKSLSVSDELTNLEKEMLMLLVASENCSNLETRSVTSCIKRYAKLTEISLKAAAISLVDMQSGVEYATRELKAMGPEYDC